ncbi:hypothetical protein PR202_ga14085 [Eleusine coracana subsp. coracana]|uniref:Late embryogenesis abundant protein LEA-2 subgroup domain-containing protein n=1 Tax=Eleusine coracana subsp. coracana TaxID=191504 RepID=A0AAV5CFN5_ELECO|nr:hypothetical protein PR202_ga14085 [Eleusine coracana subsp. coracana]
MAFWEDWYNKLEINWKKVAIWAAVIAVICGLIAVLVIAFAVVKPPTATANDAVLERFALAAGDPAANSTLRPVAPPPPPPPPPPPVSLSFNGTRFDESGKVPGFEHAARKTATFNIKVGGVDKPIKLSAPGVKEFRAQNETGKFDVELRLDTVMQYKGRSTKCPLVVICPLQLQLVDPEVAATAFQRTKCTILRAKKSGC